MTQFLTFESLIGKQVHFIGIGGAGMSGIDEWNCTDHDRSGYSGEWLRC